MSIGNQEFCYGQTEAGLESCVGIENNEQLFQLFGRQACASCAECRITNLERETTHDALTGIRNRRGLEDEYTRLYELGSPIGGIMIDVRSFGKVNTKLGHPGGDAALRLTADFLTHNLRENDAIVTRMGGDEFVLLLDLTPAAGEETRLTPGERLESVATRLMESYAEINSVMTYNEHVASRDEAIGLRIKSGVVIPTEENCDLLGFLRRIDPKGAIAEAYSENPEDYQVVTDPNEAFTNYIDQYIKRQTD